MREPNSLSALARSVLLRAPGRLHLGFLDPSGTLGRRFGSIGLVIDGFETALDLCAAPADRLSSSEAVDPADVQRAAAHLAAMREHTGLRQPLHLRLLQSLPTHAGLGSGTQLALAVGRAFARWHGLELPTPTLAHWLGRGLRSGVGIAGFDAGGLLVDGGPAADGAPAALLSRLDFPADWRIVVVLDPRHRGLSGSAEKAALATLLPLPQAAAADICHQLLMRVLPGAAAAEFAPFVAGLARIQQLLGEHFAAAQGGSAFTSDAVGRVLRWMASNAASGAGQPVAIGQSSWGPTGFAIVESQAQADQLVAAAQAAQVAGAGLELRIVSARNHGARIDLRPPLHAIT